MSENILIVDDSLYMRTLIREALEASGFVIVGEASSGAEAIDLAFELEPDLITVDNILPDMVGLEVVKILKALKWLSQTHGRELQNMMSNMQMIPNRRCFWPDRWLGALARAFSSIWPI